MTLVPTTPDGKARLLNRSLIGLTTIALVGSFLILLALPLLAYRWIQTPFMGAFVEPTLVFNSVGPQGDTHWAGIDAGLRFPQQLTAVAGQPVRDTNELARALAAHRPGETVTLAYLDANGVERQTSVALQPFPTYDLFAYFILPYLIGLAYLAIGFWVFRLRRNEAAGRAFALFCAAVAVVVGGLFDLYTTHVFSWAWTGALALAAGALLILALVFPQETSLVTRYPALRWLGLLPAGILAALGEWALYDARRPTAYAAAWRNEYAFAGLSLLVFLGFTVYRVMRPPSAGAREQARIILWGFAPAFGPIIYFLVLSTARAPITFNVALYFFPLLIFPLAVAYAILRYRMTIRRILLAGSLSFLMLGAASASITLWTLQAQQYDALVIYLAGHQRALTQKMTLEVLGIQIGASPAYRQELYNTDYAHFEKTLNALIAGEQVPHTGGATVTLPPTHDPEILAQLKQVRATWEEMTPAV